MPANPPVVFVPPANIPVAFGSVTPGAPYGRDMFLIEGVTTTGINGPMFYCGRIDGYPAWSRDGSPVTSALNVILSYISGTTWRLMLSVGTLYTATKVSAAVSPDGLTGWAVSPGEGSPVITIIDAPTPPEVFTPEV